MQNCGGCLLLGRVFSTVRDIICIVEWNYRCGEFSTVQGNHQQWYIISILMDTRIVEGI